MEEIDNFKTGSKKSERYAYLPYDNNKLQKLTFTKINSCKKFTANKESLKA